MSLKIFAGCPLCIAHVSTIVTTAPQSLGSLASGKIAPQCEPGWMESIVLVFVAHLYLSASIGSNLIFFSSFLSSITNFWQWWHGHFCHSYNNVLPWKLWILWNHLISPHLPIPTLYIPTIWSFGDSGDANAKWQKFAREGEQRSFAYFSSDWKYRCVTSYHLNFCWETNQINSTKQNLKTLCQERRRSGSCSTRLHIHRLIHKTFKNEMKF